MDHLQLRYETRANGEMRHTSLDVPDIRMALVVADINVGAASAELLVGSRLIARLERHGHSPAAYWLVNRP